MNCPLLCRPPPIPTVCHWDLLLLESCGVFHLIRHQRFIRDTSVDLIISSHRCDSLSIRSAYCLFVFGSKISWLEGVRMGYKGSLQNSSIYENIGSPSHSCLFLLPKESAGQSGAGGQHLGRSCKLSHFESTLCGTRKPEPFLKVAISTWTLLERGRFFIDLGCLFACLLLWHVLHGAKLAVQVSDRLVQLPF